RRSGKLLYRVLCQGFLHLGRPLSHSLLLGACLSPRDLAGYGLVETLLVRFANGILIGMSSATETLCGQAFGAKQYHMMGIFLQRVMACLCCYHDDIVAG
ncbi:hypothetical protein M569_07171, partial [Genlisea aurea]